MSRDELPQYMPNVALTSFETPPRSFQPLWATPSNANLNPGTPIVFGTGFQTYPAYLATPSPHNLQMSITKRSHKWKSDENSGQSAPKKPRKGRSHGLGLLLDSTTPNLRYKVFFECSSRTNDNNHRVPGKSSPWRNQGGVFTQNCREHVNIGQILWLRLQLRLAHPTRVWCHRVDSHEVWKGAFLG